MRGPCYYFCMLKVRSHSASRIKIQENFISAAAIWYGLSIHELSMNGGWHKSQSSTTTSTCGTSLNIHALPQHDDIHGCSRRMWRLRSKRNTWCASKTPPSHALTLKPRPATSKKGYLYVAAKLWQIRGGQALQKRSPRHEIFLRWYAHEIMR